MGKYVEDGEAFTKAVDREMSRAGVSRLDLADRVAKKTGAQQNAVYQRIRRAQKTNAWDVTFAGRVAAAIGIKFELGKGKRS